MRPKNISSFNPHSMFNIADLQDRGGLERQLTRLAGRSSFHPRSLTSAKVLRPLVAPPADSFFAQKFAEWVKFFEKPAPRQQADPADDPDHHKHKSDAREKYIDDFVWFNRKLALFDQEMAASPRAMAVEEKLDRLIAKINSGIFSWREQYRHVRQLTEFFQLMRPFTSHSHYLFIDMEGVRQRLYPFSRFDPFFRMPYYSDDSHHFFATAIYIFYNTLFMAFLRVYVSFPTGAYPRIDDEMFTLIDPFTREKIREANRERYRKQVEDVHGFELVRLLNQMVERFLITEALRWGKEEHSNVVVPLLMLVNEALALGLIRAGDCQQLMLNLQLLTEALAFIEESIVPGRFDEEKRRGLFLPDEEYFEPGSPDSPELRSPTKSQRLEAFRFMSQPPRMEDPTQQARTPDNHEDLQLCKLLISKIILQVIFVYSDHAFVGACRRNQFRPFRIDRRNALLGRLQTNMTLYKSICLILVRYLLSKFDLTSDPRVESQLEINQCMLLIYLTDSERNYFVESVDLVHMEHADRYLNGPTPDLAARVEQVLALQSEILAMIRNPSKYQTRTNILDKISDLCQEVPERSAPTLGRVTTEPDPYDLTAYRTPADFEAVDLPFTLELAWRGVTRFSLLLVEKMGFHDNEKLYMNHAFDLLRRLLKNNHVAQSLLFRGGTCYSYTEIFLQHKFRSMALLIDVFEHDFVMLNQSYQVFDIKMVFYHELMVAYVDTRAALDAHPASHSKLERFRKAVSSLLLFNIFLDKVMKLNIRASKDKWRKYDLVMQLKIVDLVASEVLPALLNPAFLSPAEQEQIDLMRIGRFRFTKDKAKELSNLVESSSRNVALYYLYYTFLKLFVISTTFVYPRVVFEKITAALEGFRPQDLLRSFPTAIMLRTQIVKLVDRFWVFPNNHQLYEGLRHSEIIQFRRPMFAPEIKRVFQLLEYELMWFKNVPADLDNPNDNTVVMLRDYLYWALLPAVYKVTRAVLSTLSILEDPFTISNLRYYCERLASMLAFKDRTDRIYQIFGRTPPDPDQESKRSLAALQDLARKSSSLAIFESEPLIDEKEKDIPLPSLESLPGLDTDPGANPNLTSRRGRSKTRGGSFRRSGAVTRGLQARSRKSYYRAEASISNKAAYSKIGNEVIEERLNPYLHDCRRHADKVAQLVESFFDPSAGTEDPLLNYRRTDRTWMFKHAFRKPQAATEKSKRRQFALFLKTARDQKKSVIWVVQQIYAQKHFSRHGDKNPLIRLLTSDSHFRTYNYNVARSCISMLANMTPGDDADTYYRCFFVKQIYADEMQAVNYLMNHSAELRIQMFKLLDDSAKMEEGGPDAAPQNHLVNFEGRSIASAFLRGVWAIYVNLTLFIYYKTFDDKYLEFHWRLNLMVSEFFRNFFMNNFNEFKTFLSDKRYGVTPADSHSFPLERDPIVMVALPEPTDTEAVLKEEPGQDGGKSPDDDSFSMVPGSSKVIGEGLGLAPGDVERLRGLEVRDDDDRSGSESPPSSIASEKVKKSFEREGRPKPGKINIPESPKSELSGTPKAQQRTKPLHPMPLNLVGGEGVTLPGSPSSELRFRLDSGQPQILIQPVVAGIQDTFVPVGVSLQQLPGRALPLKPSTPKPRNAPRRDTSGNPPRPSNPPDDPSRPSLGDGDGDSASDNTPDEPRNETIFMENFVLMSDLFGNCSVARDLEVCIVPSDRANVFAVLVQVMKTLTEFVTGPCLPNQLRIFDHETYIWIGVLNRYIEDVDDDFYHVKLAVLDYLLGLMQGLDHRIIDYLAQQLQVHSLFEITVTMARLLYLRFYAVRHPGSVEDDATLIFNDKNLLRKERAFRYANYSKRNHFNTIVRRGARGPAITSPAQMMDLYRTDPDFNSHLLMQIVVNSYVFMRSVGDKIKFWHIYLKEREEQAAKWDSRAHDRETNVVFQFVLDMIFSIEIVYEINQMPEDDSPGPDTVPHVDITDANNKSLSNAPASAKGSLRRDPSVAEAAARRTSKALSSLHLLGLNNGDNINPILTSGEARKRIQRRFYFQTPPICLYWTPAMKSRVMDRLPVKSTNRKQVYLYSKIRQLTIEAETHSDRRRRFGWLAYLVTPDAFSAYEVFLFLFSLAQNILLMVFLTEKPTERAFVQNFANYHTLQIAWALALTALSFLVLVLWMASRWSIYMTLNEKDQVARRRRQLTRPERLRVYLLDSLILNSTFSSFLLNFIITILGLTVYTGIYTLNLFLAVKIFKPMTDVMRAIFQSGRQLLSTFQLMTLLIYFYSWVTVLGLTDRIVNYYNGPENCRDLWGCLINTWNFGLRESGGLGAALNALQEPDHNRFWLNWIISISYLILVKFIVLNIVAGIIIEGFGELRDERSKREFDVLNFCPICGMDRWESERVGLRFQEHLEKVHNVWNYLKFLVRLNQIPDRDLVGFEFDISNQLHYNQTKWFPRNKVLSEESGYQELSDGDGNDSESESDDD